MALSDIKAFLIDLLFRYDPDLDVSEGSRAQSELIDPILARIGGDPFDDDIEAFIRTRVQQVFPNLAITEADEFTDLVIDPMRVLLEPITREIQLVKLRHSLANINRLSDDEVDALMGNFFEARQGGGYATGPVRAYFAAPQTISVTLVHIAQSRGGNRYLVPAPQSITAEQMLLNIDGSEYYFDINYVAENRGAEYNVERGEINSIANLPAVTRVTNLRRFTGGLPRESSADYVARVQRGSSDKTLTTAPGIIAVLHDSFPALRQVFEVGYGDPEMKRDILQGGSVGSIPVADDLGEFFGMGVTVDDLDADDTTPILEAATGNFVSRLGAVGRRPDGWYVTVTYFGSTLGALIVRDVQVLEVLSDQRVRIDHEMPLERDIIWALREKKLTISGIPGGIALPDTSLGSLSLPSDSVHVGGKTDIFVAGEVEVSSAQIAGLSDEEPIARGFAAQTQAGEIAGDVILLADISSELVALIQGGMSLVLSEGSDAGAYRILEVLTGPNAVRVDAEMTGVQSNLAWKIVDELDVDLIQPKNVLLEGSDLILAAGSDIVLVAGSINFSGAGIRANDVLFVDNDDYGGDFTIVEVTATSLRIDPPAVRALSGVHYVVSRRSEGVQPPVVRIAGLELLDSAGAPNGTVIPYREPVLCLSRAFQNEASGFRYDAPALLGLVSTAFTGTFLADGLTVDWAVYDPSRAWTAPLATGTVTLIDGTAEVLAAHLSANASLQAQAVRAVALSYGGKSYVGFTSQRYIVATGGTALAALGWAAGSSNAMVRGITSFADLKVRRGDLIECVSGNNSGRGLRVITEPAASTSGVTVGTGPFGPPGTSAIYDIALLSPDAGGRIRIARPSVGGVRCYFLEPTSIDFAYATTRMRATINGQERVYQPDPENTRILVPPPPSTTLPAAGNLVGSSGYLEDIDGNFLRYGIKEGDLLDILYRPIKSTSTLTAGVDVALSGLTISLQLDNDPFILIAFPFAMNPADLVDYINTQVGTIIAAMESDYLVLKSSRRIELAPDSTALSVLFISTLTTDHPSKGTFIVQSVTTERVYAAFATPFVTGTVAGTHYRIRRYLQRTSSTEMNVNTDASGLYYADVEAVSVLPGDLHNIGTDVELEITGYRSDGYRLLSKNHALSFSRAEDLHAQISRTILLPGASDNPIDYVQLNLQNVQVNYERSALADEIQSFCSSRFRRVICEDILVRHLTPHYVSLNWRYAGGPAEPEMTRAIVDFLAKVAADTELEVGDLTALLRGKQATSVFTVDAGSPTGRTAPLLLVVRHDEDRRIRASLVRDAVATVRMSTYLPGDVLLKRLSSAGLR